MIERLMRVDYLGEEDISAVKKNFDGKYKSHWHEFYEIEYIVSGSGIYEIDGIEYKIIPGALFFMTPVDFHSVSANNIELYNIQFSALAANTEILAEITERNFPTFFELKGKTLDFIEVQLEEMTTNHDDRQFQSTILNCILAKLLKLEKNSEKTALSPISKAQLYILNRFRDNVSLSDVAKYVGFSVSYFSMLFKKETGKTFKDYINNLKFEYAEKLLKYTDFTVLQICNESGFEDYANFLRRFKERTKLSPTEYRKHSK